MPTRASDVWPGLPAPCPRGSVEAQASARRCQPHAQPLRAGSGLWTNRCCQRRSLRWGTRSGGPDACSGPAGPAGRGTAVTPIPWGSTPTPPPAGTHTDLALGVQEESHTSAAGAEVHGLLAQGRGQLLLGAAGPLAPNLVDIMGWWVRSGGGLSRGHGGSRGAGRTVTWCRGASSVPGGKRYVHTGKSCRCCCSLRPPRSTVSSSDWLRTRTNLSRPLTATIFRQEPVGLG